MKTLRQLKNVLIGYSSDDIEKTVDIDDADELDIYGSLKGWSKEQVRKISSRLIHTIFESVATPSSLRGHLD